MTEPSQITHTDSIEADLYFAIIPEWVLNLPISSNAIRVYCVLRRFADNQTGECFPSRKTVAMKARLSVSTLDRAIKELVDNGAVTVNPRKNQHGDWSSNLYTVRAVPKGREVYSPARTPLIAGGRTGVVTGGERTKANGSKTNNAPRKSYEETEYDRGVEFGSLMRRQRHPREQVIETSASRSKHFQEGAVAGYDGVTGIAPAARPAMTPERRSTWHDKMD